jgi:hypothetical protein
MFQFTGTYKQEPLLSVKDNISVFYISQKTADEDHTQYNFWVTSSIFTELIKNWNLKL